MTNKKNHWHIHISAVPALAFIVAVAAAVGYMVWSKTYLGEEIYYPFEVYRSRTAAIDSEEWKLYRNEELGFAVKYPEEFSAAFDNTAKVLKLGADLKSREANGLQISIKDNPQNTSPLNWWKQSKNYKASFVVENIKGDGAAGIKVYSADRRVFVNYVFLPRDKSIYEFYWTTLNERIADEILSTFFFFTPVDPLAGWQTYESLQHGFAFKYPKEVSVTVQTDAAVRFEQKKAAVGTLPAVYIHSMEVSRASQLWLDTVLPNYVLTSNKPVIDGQVVSTAAGRGEYINHTLYIIPKASGTVALVEFSNSDLGKKILSTFKFTK